MPLLSLALPPTKVVPFVVVLQVIVGTGGIRSAWRLCDWRAVRGLSPGLVLGLPLGVAVLTALDANTVRLVIGGLILASVLILWRGFALPARPSRLVTAVFGLAGGIMSGLASMGGPPIVVYLIALSHRAVVVRASSIVYFMLAGVLSLLVLLWRGLIDRQIMLWSIASVPVLIAGSYAGSWGFRRSKAHHHRNTALITLLVLGLVLIARASVQD